MNYKKLFSFLILLIFLELLSGNADAATLAWTKSGGDNLASNPSNWSGGKVPQHGDVIIFNSASTDDCIWDLPLVSASFTISSGYTGKIVLNSDLEVAEVVVWTDGSGDGQASNPANWSTNKTPQNGDKVIFNDTSSHN